MISESYACRSRGPPHLDRRDAMPPRERVVYRDSDRYSSLRAPHHSSDSMWDKHLLFSLLRKQHWQIGMRIHCLQKKYLPQSETFH